MNETTKTPAGTTAREDFSGRELSTGAETSSSAVAAQAAATVQARYLVAWKRPRDMDQVRVALLKECARPAFAAIARYRKPIGKGVEGLSVRFAEAAIRAMGNVLTEVATIYDDETKRILRVTVTDLETNTPYSRDITVDKTVERSVVKPGTHILRTRLNAAGNPSHTIQATEDDLLNKEGALVSKAFRTLALRIIPGDLKDEGERKVFETLENGVTKDPDGERKKIADAFSGIGVSPTHLKEYLGHDLAQCAPSEIVELRAIYAAIRDGEATWAETFEHRDKDKKTPAPKDAPKTEPAKSEAKTPEVLPASKPLSAEELKAAARAKAAGQ